MAILVFITLLALWSIASIKYWYAKTDDWVEATCFAIISVVIGFSLEVFASMIWTVVN